MLMKMKVNYLKSGARPKQYKALFFGIMACRPVARQRQRNIQLENGRY
jgi:hypothetical protein